MEICTQKANVTTVSVNVPTDIHLNFAVQPDWFSILLRMFVTIPQMLLDAKNDMENKISITKCSIFLHKFIWLTFWVQNMAYKMIKFPTQWRISNFWPKEHSEISFSLLNIALTRLSMVSQTISFVSAQIFQEFCKLYVYA